MKLCIDCKHYEGHKFCMTAPTCGHPDVQELSLVDGKPIHPSCEMFRYFGDCGGAGSLFEAKELK